MANSDSVDLQWRRECQKAIACVVKVICAVEIICCDSAFTFENLRAE